LGNSLAKAALVMDLPTQSSEADDYPLIERVATTLR